MFLQKPGGQYLVDRIILGQQNPQTSVTFAQRVTGNQGSWLTLLSSPPQNIQNGFN
jgi:hypothetical protein